MKLSAQQTVKLFSQRGCNCIMNQHYLIKWQLYQNFSHVFVMLVAFAKFMFELEEGTMVYSLFHKDDEVGGRLGNLLMQSMFMRRLWVGDPWNCMLAITEPLL